ncbi:hypothetical protein CASFOL_041723 [Castilleja foliolosa]|uniref:RING-type domain-containing protein n=1 Tax=Castilleja foliolosa TaxID=1961234 RepID=A0ABD3B8P2_9LAMI
MSNTFTLTPPPPPVSFIVSGSAAAITQQSPPSLDRPSSVAASFVIVIIIIASAVILSATIYILLRFLSRRFHRSFRTFAAADDVVSSTPNLGHHLQQQQQCQTAPDGLLDKLPLFSFNSVTGNLKGGDCAVCLSKFEAHDQLRLLPLCCHAFHATCIDTWILANQTCPLCRSTVLPSDSEILDKLVAADQNRGIGSFNSNRSFRIEIGSISRRRDGTTTDSENRERRRSYSIGSFDYILEGNGYEVSEGSTNNHQRGVSDSDKESFVGITMPEPPGEALAAEVSGGPRNWLRDYVDRLGSVSISSRAMSFRSSGRFFSGSSRRSEIPAEDLEANRVGEEISELFRWLSGI